MLEKESNKTKSKKGKKTQIQKINAFFLKNNNAKILTKNIKMEFLKNS